LYKRSELVCVILNPTIVRGNDEVKAATQKVPGLANVLMKVKLGEKI